MRALVRSLGAFVALNATTVVIGVIAVTIMMVGFASQALPLDNSQASFAPDSPELRAAIELQDRFADNDTLALQVIVTTRSTLDDPGTPVLTPEGVAGAVEAEAILRRELGDVIVAGPGRPDVLSFVAVLQGVAEATGRDLADLDQQELAQAWALGLSQVPAEQAEFLRRLLAGDPDEATTGLMIATLDASAYAEAEDPEAARNADQLDFAAVITGSDLGAVDALPFSFVLLQADDGSFQEELGRLFGMAILVVLLVLAFVVRARRGTTLGRPGAIRRTIADTALGLSVVVLANIWVNGLQVVMGPGGLGLVGAPTPPTMIVSILLIALGVDYSIHLQERYRFEIGRGAEPGEAVRTAGGTVGSAILMGAMTTAVGFLTNLTSPLGPIRDLGVLAAVGLVSAFVLTTTWLPAVRVLLDRRAEGKRGVPRAEVAPTESQILPRIALAMGGPALRRPVVVIAVGALVTALGAGGISQLKTEFDLAAFLPEGSDQQRAFVLVTEEFAGGLGEQTSVLLTGDDVLSTASHNAQLTALQQLAGSEGVVTTAGVVVGQAPPLVVLGAVAEAQQPDAPAPLKLAVAAAFAAGLQPDGWIDGDAGVVYAALSPTGILDGVVDFPSGVDDAPVVRWVISTQSTRTGAELVADDFDTALGPVREVGVEAVATGDLIINLGAIDALQASQIRGLGFAFFAVLGLLTLVYGRRLGRWDFGLLLMIPVAAVAICTLGLMALTGIPFDPVTATVSALVIGVGIDFTVHLGERFVEDLGAVGDDPVAALRASIQHTGSALAGSALTTVLGFAVLITGTLVPFQRLGSTTVYAVGLSLFAVIALQPAILLVWARRHKDVLADFASRND